ncbi:MAG: prephenate dehydratase [Gemmatimonadota bacterium]|nr:prephenate dehydratase [Gemmatimonadota bacterium]
MSTQPITTVAIQGERGAFSHAAAIQIVGPSVRIVACRTFEDVFRAVASGDADVGIVPVENTLAGAVQRPMDLLASRDVLAVAETRVPIRLCLATPPETRLEDIETVASHPVALEQCLRFFDAHPAIQPHAVYDTAGSIRDLMAGGADYQAAIGSELAAELYGARILQRALEDDPANYTRFLAVTQDGEVMDPDRPKTSLAFTVPHVPGSLHRALGCFAEEAVDLARLESRPIPGHPWEYRFFADLRGSNGAAHDRAIAALEAVSGNVRIIGRYEEVPEGDS